MRHCTITWRGIHAATPVSIPDDALELEIVVDDQIFMVGLREGGIILRHDSRGHPKRIIVVPDASNAVHIIARSINDV